MRTASTPVLALLALLAASPARAEWPTDPALAFPVLSGANQWSTTCAADGAGGLYVFGHPRSGGHIVAQRIDGSGRFVWPSESIPVGVSNIDQSSSDMGESDVFASGDGACGALVMWMRDVDSLRIQRLAPDGSRLWADEGAVVADTCLQLQQAVVIADGQGGAIAAWCERRSRGFDYYAQRLSTAGSRLWRGAGVLLGRIESVDSTFVIYRQHEMGPELVADGLGGAFIAFARIVPPTSQTRVFVQHVDANGVSRWPSGGFDVFPDSVSYLTVQPSMCADGVGGLIVGAQGVGTAPDHAAILIQRLDANGHRLWTSSGRNLQIGNGWQFRPIVRTDGAGGAFVAWSQYPYLLYVQHLDGGGQTDWPAPVFVGTSVRDFEQKALPDGIGGLNMLWTDTSSGYELRAQRIGRDGALRWAPQGVLMRTVEATRIPHLSCASDGAGGVFAAWATWTDASGYGPSEARWVSADGRLGTAGVGEPTWTAGGELRIFPNPAVGHVAIRCSVARPGPVRLDVFDIGGRRLRTLWNANTNVGSIAVDWDGLDDSGSRLPTGIYLVRLSGRELSLTRRVVLVDR